MDPDEIAIQLQQQSNPLLIVEEQHSPPTTEQHPPALLQIPSQDRSFKPNRYQYRLHPSTVSSRVQRLFTSPHSRSALQQALQDAGTADSRSFAHCDLAHHLVPRTSVPVQCKLPGGHTVLGVDFVNQGGDPGGAPNLRIFANLEAQPQHRGEQQLLLQQRDVNGATAGEQNLNLRSASFLLYRAPLETSYRAELGSQVLRNRKISFYAMLLVHLLITLYLQFINPFLEPNPNVAVTLITAFMMTITIALVNVIGLVGVYGEYVRMITIFIVAHAILLVIDIVAIPSILYVTRMICAIALMTMASNIRSKLMYSWFSTPGI